MSDHPPTCALCLEEYTLEPGYEPTRYCDSCAHRIADKARVIAEALKCLVDRLRELEKGGPLVLLPEWWLAELASGNGAITQARQLGLLEEGK